MKMMRDVMLLAALVISLSGCQTDWDARPDFGSYVNGAVQAQLQNPNAPKGAPKSVVGLDGRSADAAVTSYQKTFERKAPQQTQSSGSITGSSLSVQ